jgi:hypothetical protein
MRGTNRRRVIGLKASNNSKQQRAAHMTSRNQSSSSSSFPITCTGSSVRTREYHGPRDAVGVAVSSIALEASFIGGASDALRPDVAYSVIKKTMCVYSTNAMLVLRGAEGCERRKNVKKEKKKKKHPRQTKDERVEFLGARLT